MMHRFWCWVSLKAQTEIVKGARIELAKHMARRREAESCIVNGQELPPYLYSQWRDRGDQLQLYLKQEQGRLTMMGGKG